MIEKCSNSKLIEILSKIPLGHPWIIYRFFIIKKRSKDSEKNKIENWNSENADVQKLVLHFDVEIL